MSTIRNRFDREIKVRFDLRGNELVSYDLLSCPDCGGELYRSRRQGLLERYFFGILHMRAFRCHRCRKRYLCLPTFFFRAREREDEEERSKRKKRRSSESTPENASPPAGDNPKPDLTTTHSQ
jgi:hypothetical protein